MSNILNLKSVVLSTCLFSAILSPGISIAQDSISVIDQRAKVAKNYQALKKKAASEKVRVMVKFKQEPSSKSGNKSKASAAMDRSLAKMQSRGLTAKKRLERSGIAVYVVDASELDQLIDSGEVSAIEEDRVAKPMLEFSVSFINADNVHSSGFDGAGGAVAILDTGIDTSHPDFGGRIVAEACFSTTDPSFDAQSLCPNGSESAVGPGTGGDCTSTGAVDCDHGTLVAGIAAGVNGVAPGADIISIQVFSLHTALSCSNNGNCVKTQISDQVEALQWVLENASTYNIRVVNMSIGGFSNYTSYCDDTFLAQKIRDLKANGIATVVASGNDGYNDAVSHPGCVSDAITVGAVANHTNWLWSGSNSSYGVDLLAPGMGIDSSAPGGGQGFGTGTSMATPHVAGAIMLLREINEDASVDMMESWLKSRGVFATDPKNFISLPRINLNNASLNFDNHEEFRTRLEFNNYGYWFQSTNDTNEWSRTTGGTPSGSTGPVRAYEGDGYLYLETSAGGAYTYGNNAVLESWKIYGSQRALTFNYHMHGADMGELFVDVKSGANWSTIWSRSGQQHSYSDTPWATAAIDLSNFTGAITLRIRGVADGGYRGDMAIDNISILGQGLAVAGEKVAEYGDPVSGNSFNGCNFTQIYSTGGGGYLYKEYQISCDTGTYQVGVQTNTSNNTCQFYPDSSDYRASGTCSNWRVYLN